MRLKPLGEIVGILLLALATASFAQGGGGQNSLPNGRPFQMLQQSINELEAALQAQIADLQTQLNVNGQNDALQDQLIGALQAAVGMLEQRMANAEASIDQLDQYNALQNALLEQQMSQISNLQNQVNSQGADINSLFELHNAQQSAINGLQGQINFLQSQNTTQNGQIESLQIQLASLQNDYNSTRTQLQNGCLLNSSIRQVIPGGAVVCDLDNGQFVVTTMVGSAPLNLGVGGMASISVFCPPPPAGSTPFVSTGGGFSLSSIGAAVLASQQIAPTGWRVTFRNTNPAGGAAVAVSANVACTRVAPPL